MGRRSGVGGLLLNINCICSRNCSNQHTADPGKPYEIEELKVDDLKAGIINVARLPIFDHPSLTEEDRVAFSKQIVAGVVLHAADGHAEGSDEWNRIFPDYKFTSVEQFLTETFGSA